MKRREFITLLGGAAAWPLAVRAQQGVPRVGVIMSYPENDPAGQARATAFRQRLENHGWAIGRNVHIDYRWGLGDADWMRSTVAQLLEAVPDVIVANGDPAARAAQKASSTVPVIFIAGSDPVANGYVQSFAHPGGNLTGFTVLEPSLGTKLLELLKDIAPNVTRVAVMFNLDNSGNKQLSEAAVAATNLGIEVIAAPIRDSTEIEAAMTKLGGEPNRGLIVLPDPKINSHRKLIVELAARHRVPAIHALRTATVDGGLMSYGVDLPDLFRQAASYVDHILRGEKPANLPVQQPTKFELVINLKTAKALGLTAPPSLLARADEVID
jgi:putative tryptophan/tyrosine transport system substrate-binding protein